MAFGPVGCGDDGGPPRTEDGAPVFTSSWGRYAFAFFGIDEMSGELDSALAYSDGSRAVLVLMPGNTIAHPRAARIVGRVATPYIVELENGQVNVDADGTFGDSDLVPAVGLVTLDLTRQALGTGEQGIEVGTVLRFPYTFFLGLGEVVRLDGYGEPGSSLDDLIYGAGFPRP